MTANLIHDRGRGPEIVGTRITVYNLLPHFLDGNCTEADICKTYRLTAEQVAAARAYILNHPDQVLAEHLKIESRIEKGNPPEVIERAKQTHKTFLSFKQWLSERETAEAKALPAANSGHTSPTNFPSFNEWRSHQQSRSEQGS